jgi:ribosomal-protein-serine acetyltransferase
VFRLAIRPGLHLGLLELRHAPLLWALVERNRARLELWLPWVPKTQGVADVEGFLRQAAQQYVDGNGFHAGIFLDDELVGMIGLHPIDWQIRKVELGYWLDAAAEGRGLIADAVTFLTGYCFTEYQLERVEIRCADPNLRSAAVPERLGFRHEATLRGAELIGTRRLDLRIYGILRPDWPSTTARGAEP